MILLLHSGKKETGLSRIEMRLIEMMWGVPVSEDWMKACQLVIDVMAAV